MADIDSDGDLDVVSIVGWYENVDGKGTFEFVRLQSIDIFASADVDGDGDLDILSRGYVCNDACVSTVDWFENTNGDGKFSDPKIMAKNISQGGTAFHAADVDGDGDADILAAHHVHPNGPSTLAWYENTEGNLGPQNVISMTTSSKRFHRSISTVDLDGDGDLDVLAASRAFGIFWYENTDGMGTFGPADGEGVGPRQVIGPSPRLLVHPVDLDDDGDIDIVTAGDEGIVWLENTDGMATFGSPKIINRTPRFDDVLSVHVADMDADGDLDVLAEIVFHPRERSIVWYDNLGVTLEAGDANHDGLFNQLDIVQVLQADKYLAGKPALFEEGDWNNDGVFDQWDLVAALQTGTYLHGPAALTMAKGNDTHEVTAVELPAAVLDDMFAI